MHTQINKCTGSKIRGVSAVFRLNAYTTPRSKLAEYFGVVSFNFLRCVFG